MIFRVIEDVDPMSLNLTSQRTNLDNLVKAEGHKDMFLLIF